MIFLVLGGSKFRKLKYLTGKKMATGVDWKWDIRHRLPCWNSWSSATIAGGWASVKESPGMGWGVVRLGSWPTLPIHCLLPVQMQCSHPAPCLCLSTSPALLPCLLPCIFCSDELEPSGSINPSFLTLCLPHISSQLESNQASEKTY